VCGPYRGAKGSVGNDVVQRGREGVNWMVGGEYRSVWTVFVCGAKGSVGSNAVQRVWEGVNWIVDGEYRSVWTLLWGED
jgi:hypothetical protein